MAGSRVAPLRGQRPDHPGTLAADAIGEMPERQRAGQPEEPDEREPEPDLHGVSPT